MPKILVPEDRTLEVHKFSCVLSDRPAGVPPTTTFKVRDRFAFFPHLDAFRRKKVSEARVRRLLMTENCIHVGDDTYRVDQVSYEGSETEETDITHENLSFFETIMGNEGEAVTETRPVIEERLLNKEIKNQIYSEE